MLVIKSESEADTLAAGRKLAELLRAGDIVCLTGDLGAGKTVFVRGLAQHLGIEAEVTSPTFAILNVYQADIPVYHFDLYRLDKEEELWDIGFDEYVGTDGIALIEWADKFPGNIPAEHLQVELKTIGSSNRSINIIPHGERYHEICKEWSKVC